MFHLFPPAVIISNEDVVTALQYAKGRRYFDAVALPFLEPSETEMALYKAIIAHMIHEQVKVSKEERKKMKFSLSFIENMEP